MEHNPLRLRDSIATCCSSSSPMERSGWQLPDWPSVLACMLNTRSDSAPSDALHFGKETNFMIDSAEDAQTKMDAANVLYFDVSWLAQVVNLWCMFDAQIAPSLMGWEVNICLSPIAAAPQCSLCLCLNCL